MRRVSCCPLDETQESCSPRSPRVARTMRALLFQAARGHPACLAGLSEPRRVTRAPRRCQRTRRRRAGCLMAGSRGPFDRPWHSLAGAPFLVILPLRPPTPPLKPLPLHPPEIRRSRRRRSALRRLQDSDQPAKRLAQTLFPAALIY